MKLVGTSRESHGISQNSLRDTTCFLHEDHRKNSKELQKDTLYIKRKIEFGRGKVHVERKLLVQEQLQ